MGAVEQESSVRPPLSVSSFFLPSELLHLPSPEALSCSLNSSPPSLYLPFCFSGFVKTESEREEVWLTTCLQPKVQWRESVVGLVFWSVRSLFQPFISPLQSRLPFLWLPQGSPKRERDSPGPTKFDRTGRKVGNSEEEDPSVAGYYCRLSIKVSMTGARLRVRSFLRHLPPVRSKTEKKEGDAITPGSRRRQRETKSMAIPIFDRLRPDTHTQRERGPAHSRQSCRWLLHTVSSPGRERPAGPRRPSVCFFDSGKRKYPLQPGKNK